MHHTPLLAFSTILLENGNNAFFRFCNPARSILGLWRKSLTHTHRAIVFILTGQCYTTPNLNRELIFFQVASVARLRTVETFQSTLSPLFPYRWKNISPRSFRRVPISKERLSLRQRYSPV